MSKTVTDLKMSSKRALPNDITLQRIEEMAQRTQNWGRWGPDDEIGTSATPSSRWRRG